VTTRKTKAPAAIADADLDTTVNEAAEDAYLAAGGSHEPEPKVEPEVDPELGELTHFGGDIFFFIRK
jgi:hypothetical protein